MRMLVAQGRGLKLEGNREAVLTAAEIAIGLTRQVVRQFFEAIAAIL